MFNSRRRSGAGLVRICHQPYGATSTVLFIMRKSQTPCHIWQGVCDLQDLRFTATLVPIWPYMLLGRKATPNLNIPTLTLTYTHTHPHIYSPTHTLTHTYIHPHTHSSTHTLTHRHPHTHTPQHTHYSRFFTDCTWDSIHWPPQPAVLR